MLRGRPGTGREREACCVPDVHGGRTGRADRGSVLALIPAGFLVLVLLSALAVDSAVAYLGQRQLHDALSAAANDAVTAGLDDPAFYRNGTLILDPATVDRTVCAAIAAQGDPGLHDLQLTVAVAGSAVRVAGAATVDAVFGRAIPGFGRRSVRSSAQAAVESGPGRAPAVLAGGSRPLQC